MATKLSVVIPAYNAASFIEEALESIFAENISDCEIIVVDDGSTDRTLEILKKYAARIRVLQRDNSGSCSIPRNDGFQISKGEYLTIFDADDVAINGKLSRQVRFLDQHPEIGFVFTDFANWDGTRLSPSHLTQCGRFSGLAKRRVGDGEYVIAHQVAYETLLTENFIAAPSMMFRRSLLEKVGTFDPEMKSSEDIDFSFRVTREHDIGFIDIVGFKRRLHGTNMSFNTEKVLRFKLLSREKQIAVPKSGEAQRELEAQIFEYRLGLASYHRHQGNFAAALRYLLDCVKQGRSLHRTGAETAKTLVTMALAPFSRVNGSK